jgi:hypothetical protein
MANYAFLSLWFQEGRAEASPEHFSKLLRLIPPSTAQPGFRRFVVRGVDLTQAPLLECEFLATTEAVRQQVEELFEPDCSCEVTAYWDLWQCRLVSGPHLEWGDAPARLELDLYGEAFDDACFRETGHILVNFGLEHLFTGHAGVLAGHAPEPENASNPTEQAFAFALLQMGALETYRQRTQENVRRLYALLKQAGETLPLAKVRLWSEGETDFAGRSREILDCGPPDSAGGTDEP